MKLRYTPEALVELQTVLTGIAEHSPQGMARVAAVIQKAERTLTDNPRIGVVTDARMPLVRRMVMRPFPHILFYEVDNVEIRIIGVRHGARKPSSMPGRM